MELFQNLILPLCIVVITVYGLIKKVPVFDCFIEGAKTGLTVAVNLIPALTALMLAVSMLNASGLTAVLSGLLSPIGKILGIPKEVIPLCLISPLSGSGSTAVLKEILSTYGADSYIGRTASVICGASETTFYAITVYFGSAGITKIRHTLPCALCADLTAFVAAALTCRIF